MQHLSSGVLFPGGRETEKSQQHGVTAEESLRAFLGAPTGQSAFLFPVSTPFPLPCQGAFPPLPYLTEELPSLSLLECFPLTVALIVICYNRLRGRGCTEFQGVWGPVKVPHNFISPPSLGNTSKGRNKPEVSASIPSSNPTPCL